MAPIEYSGARGNLFHEINPEVKNLVSVLCVKKCASNAVNRTSFIRTLLSGHQKEELKVQLTIFFLSYSVHTVTPPLPRL